MRIEGTGIEDTILEIEPLDHVMENVAFIRGGHWDYERVMYDYKIGSAETNVTYYVRIPGYAVEGDVDRGDAVIKLMTPLLGKHYYPHGVEYSMGEGYPVATGVEYKGDDMFSESLLKRTATLLNQVKAELDKFEG